MSRSPVRTVRGTFRAAAAVLSLGLVSAAPAWAGVPEPDAARDETALVEVDANTLARPIPGAILGTTGVVVDEVEPNNTPATAQPLATLPVKVKGDTFRVPFVAGQIDEDVYSFTAAAGDRVYVSIITSFGSGSEDSELDLIASDGTTVIETDDDNGTMGSLSSNIAGRVLATAGTYYVRVRQGGVTSVTSQLRPYALYLQVVSGAPTPEVEPNNNGGTPNPIPASGFMSGAVDPVGDNETFSFTANAGDTIVVVMDLDPERDGIFFNGRVGIVAFNNFYLVTGDTPPAGDSPSEALVMTTNTTGSHIIYIDSQIVGGGGPTATYTFSVFVIPPPVRTCTVYPGTGGPVPDVGSAEFTIAVPDARLIGYLRMTFNATHPAGADLDIALISPDGNEIPLLDDGFFTAANAPQFDLAFEDDAGIPAGRFGVYGGLRFQPENSGSIGARMEYFRGMQAQGTWRLRVKDDLAANTGTVNSWSLVVCDPAPRPVCAVPGPNETPIYSSDFEADDGGFTHNGTLDEWERGLPAFPPISSAHSGANAWKTDLDNTYNASANMNLVSPGIDLTGASGRITLTWWQKYQTETPTFDRYWVDVQQVGNPASAQRVFQHSGGTMTRSHGNPLVAVLYAAGWGQVQADISDFAGQMVEVIFHLETDGSVQLAGVGIDDVSVTSCQFLAGAIPAALAVDTAGNSVYEPNETVVMAPTWRNTSAAAMALTGTLSNHTGPTGATYAIPDATAGYGTIAAGGEASCSSTGDCYSVSNVMTTRPATHWDSTADEDVTAPTPVGYTWTLHIGASFTDVPASNIFYRFVETLLHNGVTGGCTTDTYCPLSPTSREQMAVFVLVSKEGAGYQPTACVAGSEMFLDVPATSPFCRWIEELARRGVVTGCGGGNYCPISSTTREQMSVFVLRTLDPALNPPACVAGSEMFSDVPAGSPFCRWIEELARRGVVTGCGGGAYCPTAEVTREQMGVFLSVTFGLTLYGV